MSIVLHVHVYSTMEGTCCIFCAIVDSCVLATQPQLLSDVHSIEYIVIHVRVPVIIIWKSFF